MNIWFFFASAFFNVYLRVIKRISFYRKGYDSSIIKNGAVVICNHRSWIDVVSVGSFFFPRKVVFVAKKELMQGAFSSKIFHALEVIPIDRDKPSVETIKKSVRKARNGSCVGIFPTGTRDSDGSEKRGAISIAKAAKVPMIVLHFKEIEDSKSYYKWRLAYNKTISYEELASWNKVEGSSILSKLLNM